MNRLPRLLLLVLILLTAVAAQASVASSSATAFDRALQADSLRAAAVPACVSTCWTTVNGWCCVSQLCQVCCCDFENGCVCT